MMPDYGFSISSASSIRNPKSTFKPTVETLFFIVCTYYFFLLFSQIIVMVSLYLGPLACGYSSSLISLKQRGFRDPDGSPDWTDHSLLLGGLVASVLPLPLSLRAFGRLKTAGQYILSG